jgi:GxxExxY protein
MDINLVSRAVIGAAIEVHRELGVGLLESAYQRALGIEMARCGLRFHAELAIPAAYKGTDLGDAYRIDFLIEGCLIVEVKAVSLVLPVHRAQVLTYLKLSQRKLGLLLNFHEPSMRNGVCRIVNDFH